MKVINIYTMTESGGAQQRAVKITKALRERGHDCETWFLFRRFATFDTVSNVKVLFPKEPNKINYILIFFILLIQIMKNKPEAIIAFGRTSNPFCLLAAFICRVPVRIAMHASPSFAYPKVTKLLDKLFGSTNIYNKIISVSRATLDTFDNYPEKYLKKCIVINNGIDKPKRILSPIFKNSNKKMIGSVGRLAEVKNHKLIIESLKFLPEEYTLIIAGEGPLRKNLQDLIYNLKLDSRVKLLGEITSDQVWDFMTSIDIFAFPSLAEAFSLTLIQAALCKVPIITIDVPIVYSVIGSDACTLSKNSPEFFSNDIKNINKEKTALAYERALQFSFEKMVDGYENIIKGNYEKSNNL